MTKMNFFKKRYAKYKGNGGIPVSTITQSGTVHFSRFSLYSENLTPKKKYEIVDRSDFSFSILDDNGTKRAFAWSNSNWKCSSF